MEIGAGQFLQARQPRRLIALDDRIDLAAAAIEDDPATPAVFPDDVATAVLLDEIEALDEVPKALRCDPGMSGRITKVARFAERPQALKQPAIGLALGRLCCHMPLYRPRVAAGLRSGQPF